MGRKTIYNSLTSESVLKNINSFNIRLRDDFLNYLRGTQKSAGTIYNYNNDLNIFFCWNYSNNGDKQFNRITKRDIISFQNWLIYENNNSPSRVKRIKSTLSSLSNYIFNILDEEEEFKNFKPIIRCVEDPVNTAVREKSVFEREELDSLLEWLVQKGQYQKACALALSMFSGVRIAELTRFKVNYFDDKNITFGFYKTPERIKTKGKGNGKFIFKYVIADEFKPYLDLWLNEREKLGIKSEWLLVSKKNDNWEQIKVGTLHSWAKTFSRVLGKDFYFHSMRHFFTTALKKRSIPDSVIQKIIGWESLDMVDIYNDLDVEEEIGMYFGNTDKKDEVRL